MKKIPPLNSIKIFYIVAKFQNFSKAAEYLGVTQAAISRQIQILEDWVGQSLFHRLHRGVELTAVGKALIYDVQKSFEGLEAAFETFSGQNRKTAKGLGKEPVRLTTLPSFAAHWFFPHLDEFLKLQPNAQVEISTGQQLIDFSKENFDLGIRFGRGNWPDLVAVPIFNKIQVPVCSPNLFSKQSLTLPEILIGNYPLIFSGSFTFWEQLISSLGVKSFFPKEKINVDDMNIAIQVAMDGGGFALLPEILVRRDLALGNLINPLKTSIQTDLGYFVVYSKNKILCEASKALVEWLKKS